MREAPGTSGFNANSNAPKYNSIQNNDFSVKFQPLISWVRDRLTQFVRPRRQKGLQNAYS